MQTEINPALLARSDVREAEAILRACVHCGFCTATCPTYQLLGDELDGPRGRIYQIKLVLEGERPTRVTQRHLDRCLTCRSCETTCPSGVRYGRLVDIGRHIVEQQVRRPLGERLLRRALIAIVPYKRRFGVLLELSRWARPLLPSRLRNKVPPRRDAGPRPASIDTDRHIIALGGCVQGAATPRTNAAAARVLERLGIDLIEPNRAGCCGAAAYHLNAHDQALAQMRRNIDAWWPAIEAGAEAILVNATGCAAVVKDYGELLRDDPAYADKAARVSSLAKDPGEVLARLDLSALGQPGAGRRIAYHAPCTQQHGQQLKQLVEPLLTQLGFQLTPVADAHLCCGSAGTYSITQPALAEQLRQNKVQALEAGDPEMIATANIGCQLHLDAGSDLSVVHWLELIDPDGMRP
jgi:glycolate oxidase iron-sulfur subunit